MHRASLLCVLVSSNLLAAIWPLDHLRFEENLGQAGKQARFIARGTSDVELGPPDAFMTFGALRMRLLRANAVSPLGVNAIAGVTNYFRSANRRQWLAGVRSFEQVRYGSLYPGVDAVFHGAGGRLEYDFQIAAFADPSPIEFAVDRGVRLSVESDGDLTIDDGSVRSVWRKPGAFQPVDGKRRQVACSFRVEGQSVAFRLGSYDRSRPLVIDPTLVYSSYIGGSANDVARGVAVDGSGNIYVAGVTASKNLPVSSTALQKTFAGLTYQQYDGDAFVAKFTSSGSLVYLTYLGGSANDVALALAVDATGNAYVAGHTNSTDFPTTPGALQTKYAGGGGGNIINPGGDTFVAKLNSSGSQLVYSTYLGGSKDEYCTAMAIDSSGNVYVAGSTLSTDFPVTTGAYQTANKGFGGQPAAFGGTPGFFFGDAYVAKINPQGNHLVFATLLGGSLDELCLALAVDPGGNVWIGGSTLSNDFPVTSNAVQKSYKGAAPTSISPDLRMGDAFLAEFSSTGTTLKYATYLGGSQDEIITALATDASGAVYATGSTNSSDFPVTAGALQTKYGGPSALAPNSVIAAGDAFVTKFDATGAIVWSTYLGGVGNDEGRAIAVDASGAIWVAGGTLSSNFPVSSDALQPKYAGTGGATVPVGDGFLARLNAQGNGLMYSSYFGGKQDDTIVALAVPDPSHVYVAGSTLSTDLAVTRGAFQSALGGSDTTGDFPADAPGDGFFAEFQFLVPVTLNAVSSAASYAGGGVAPGEMIDLFGTNMGPQGSVLGTVLDPSTNRLSTNLGGASVLFDGNPAPLIAVTNLQVSAMVPYEVAGKTSTQIEVEYNGIQSAPLTVPVQNAIPGLFSVDFSGKGQAAALNQDGSYNSASKPAAVGSVVVLFGTGDGQTNPAGVSGAISQGSPPRPLLSVTATVAGLPAAIDYAGEAPLEVAGFFQINLHVPNGTSPGPQPVVVNFGTASTQPGLTIYVGQ